MLYLVVNLRVLTVEQAGTRRSQLFGCIVLHLHPRFQDMICYST
jgi:hypothetical protein